MLMKIMKVLLKLQHILVRDLSNDKLNCSKERMTDEDRIFLQSELDTVKIMLACIEFISDEKISITQFCIKYNISLADFHYRINGINKEFQKYEIKNLQSNNIIQ